MVEKEMTIVIVGATGDLAQKKLFPALFSLFEKKKISEKTSIVAFSRREWMDDDFRNFTKESGSYSEEFLSRITYHQGFFEDRKSFDALADKINNAAEKIIFLAIAPDSYPAVITHLGESLKRGRTVPDIKLLIEKPFGKNAETAKVLQEKINQYFNTEEVFRIDHYLGKEALHRFSELCTPGATLPLVPHEIESVRAKLFETIDVQDRYEFYDATGALLDVGQNHVLEMLATVMATFLGHCSGEDVQKEREAILKSFYIKNEDAGKFVRGQYEGYVQNLKRSSETETYFKGVVRSNESLFKDIPITLEGGKALGESCAEVVITFKNGEFLAVRVQPDPHIALSKKSSIVVNPEMDAYEHVFLGAINNDQFYFPSFGEIYASWKLTDELKKSLFQSILVIYEKNTTPGL